MYKGKQKEIPEAVDVTSKVFKELMTLIYEIHTPRTLYLPDDPLEMANDVIRRSTGKARDMERILREWV